MKICQDVEKIQLDRLSRFAILPRLFALPALEVEAAVIDPSLPTIAFNLRTRLWFLAGGLMFCALGCSYGITVRRTEGINLLESWRESITICDAISPRSLQTLRRWDLESSYQKQPFEAFSHLQVVAVQTSDPDVLFALAEMSYLLGKRAEKRESYGACGFYYLCAGYAYHYLFPETPDSRTLPPSPQFGPRVVHRHHCGNGTFDSFAFDPRFRIACDLYNTGLAKCIQAAQRVGQLDPRKQIQLPTPDGRGFALSVIHHGFPWRPEEFGPLLFCSDYQVVGMENHYRGYGLGVALIGTRDPKAQDRIFIGKERTAGRYPHEVSFPVTAFFRFEGSVADLGTQRAGRLELYNSLNVQSISVRGREIPLETDLTTPLAYFLSRTDLEWIEYTGFLRADKIQDRKGIYMFEPYQPGKIPVVMVHGLLSSPLTWATMFNDLRADPKLRERYQFWFYLYATGDSYFESAADLRQELAQLRNEFDPEGKDPALKHMVMVGHSMGGLLSRLLTEDSGGEFWRLVTSRPLDSLKIADDTRSELRRMFFFEHDPIVERVIFMATPHHGSKLSPSPPARLVARFIRLPKRLLKATSDLSRVDPETLPTIKDGQLANSVDLLAPGAPALELLSSRPRPEGVHFHSIIGAYYGQGKDASDGIVPFVSAHLEGVESEVTVPANHLNVHHHPRAVLEVRRILMEHLAMVDTAVGSPPVMLPIIASPTSPTALPPVMLPPISAPDGFEIFEFLGPLF